MKKTKLILEQLDNKIHRFSDLHEIVPPENGWIYSIRQGLHMSLRQLGERLSITPQSVRKIEIREKSGSITLKGMRQVARALDMDFVYGFIPQEGSLNKMIERRASEVASGIVQRSSRQMDLEGQKNTDERLAKAIKERTEEIIRELPRYLWD